MYTVYAYIKCGHRNCGPAGASATHHRVYSSENNMIGTHIRGTQTSDVDLRTHTKRAKFTETGSRHIIGKPEVCAHLCIFASELAKLRVGTLHAS